MRCVVETKRCTYVFDVQPKTRPSDGELLSHLHFYLYAYTFMRAWNAKKLSKACDGRDAQIISRVSYPLILMLADAIFSSRADKTYSALFFPLRRVYE